MIVADAVKGRGTAMMERALVRHVGALEAADWDAAMAEIDAGLRPATREHPR